MKNWKIIETKKYGPIIAPEKELKCPFCGTPLLLHQFTPHFQSMQKFYHVDVNMKCPNEWFFTTFGIPISKEDFDRLNQSKIRNRTLTYEVLDYIEMMKAGFTEEEVETIRHRLDTLGYW